MPSHASTRNYSKEELRVIAQMTADSYLSSSDSMAFREEEQVVASCLGDYLHGRMVSTGNGGFEAEPRLDIKTIAEAIKLIQPNKSRAFITTFDTTSWVQQILEPPLSVQGLVGDFKKLDISYAGKLARRLQYLYEVRKEELPEEQPLSSDSLFSFYEFLKQNPDLEYPQVTLTYEGNIHAVWRKSDRQLFAIDFVGKDDIHYVLFAPNWKRLGRVIRISAQTTRDHLLEEIAHYQVNWVYRQG